MTGVVLAGEPVVNVGNGTTEPLTVEVATEAPVLLRIEQDWTSCTSLFPLASTTGVRTTEHPSISGPFGLYK